MLGIFPGVLLDIDDPITAFTQPSIGLPGPNFETVVVTATTATTFTAVFSNNHTAPIAVNGSPNDSYLYPGVLSQIDAEGNWVDYASVWLYTLSTNTARGAVLSPWKFTSYDDGDENPLRIYYQGQKQTTVMGVPVYVVNIMPDASNTCSGLVNTTWQTLKGNKTLQGNFTLQGLPQAGGNDPDDEGGYFFQYTSSGPGSVSTTGGYFSTGQQSYVTSDVSLGGGADTTITGSRSRPYIEFSSQRAPLP